MTARKIIFATLFVVLLTVPTILGAIPLTVYTPAGQVSLAPEVAEARARNTSNNRLSNLRVPTSGASLASSFSPATHSYTINVRDNISTVALQPVRDNSRQSVRHRVDTRNLSTRNWENGNWSGWRSGNNFNNHINVGIGQQRERRVRIAVRDHNGNIRTYTVNLRRASTNTFANRLTHNAGVLNHNFSRGRHGYVLTLPEGRSSVTLGMRAEQVNANVRTRVGSGSWSAFSRHQRNRTIDLTQGQERVVTFQVRGAFSNVASSPTRTRNYTITVRRASANTYASALNVSHGTLNRTFNRSVSDYTVTLPHDRASTTIGLNRAQTNANMRVRTHNGTSWGDWSSYGRHNLSRTINNVPNGGERRVQFQIRGAWSNTATSPTRTRTYTVNVRRAAVPAHTVTFNSHGGSTVSNRSVTNGAVIGSLPTPTRSGHTFDGWWTAQTGGFRVTAQTAVGTNITLHARWIPVQDHTLIFEGNGGTVWGANRVTLSARHSDPIDWYWMTPVRSGHTFVGWFTAATGGTQVTAGTRITSNRTLHARWSANGTQTPAPVNRTVTFNAHGGSAVSNRTVVSGQAIGTLPTTTRSGHTFDGWWTAQTGGTRVNTNTVINANTTLHARWIVVPPAPVNRTVTFNAHGGSAVSNRTVVSGQAIGTLPTPTRANHTFVGWFTAESGGTQVVATTIVSANITLHARWTPITHTVTFNSHGGSTIANRSVTNGATIGSLPTPTRAGYTFNGWFTSATGGTQVTASTTVGAAMTVHARWTAVPHTVNGWTQIGSNSNLRFNQQQSRFELTGTAEWQEARRLFDRINQHRASMGLDPFVWSQEAAEVAMQRAAEMHIYIDPSHHRPDGRAWTTADSTGLGWAENGLWGGTTYSNMFGMWLNSPGHRSIMESNTFGVGGAGVGVVTLEGRRTATLVLTWEGAPQAAPSGQPSQQTVTYAIPFSQTYHNSSNSNSWPNSSANQILNHALR